MSYTEALLVYLQYVEFSGGDEDDADGADGDEFGVSLPDPNAIKANKQHAQSLESLLMAKNKRILDELTKFRVGLIYLRCRITHMLTRRPLRSCMVKLKPLCKP